MQTAVTRAEREVSLQISDSMRYAAESRQSQVYFVRDMKKKTRVTARGLVNTVGIILRDKLALSP